MSAARLVPPSAEFRESYLAALGEFPPGEDTLSIERSMATSDFGRWLRKCEAWSRGEELPAGWVASSTFWLVEGPTYLGSANIRHKLTDWLRRYGGHIGYAIRPSRRRRGYGTLICRLALDESRKLGIARVLITCDDDNPGSRKIIERNGGELENVVPQPDRDAGKRRYWIDVSTMGAA